MLPCRDRGLLALNAGTPGGFLTTPHNQPMCHVFCWFTRRSHVV